MKTSLVSLLSAAALASGCVGQDNPPLDRDAIREQQQQAEAGGKADGLDLCAQFDLYEDGVCDRFCPRPDGDCTHDQLCLTLSGTMVDFAGHQPLAGAQVCDGASCVTTGADGAYSIEVRTDHLVDVTTQRDGYVSDLVTFLTGEDDAVYSNQLVSQSTYQLLATLFFGVEQVDPARGALVTNAYQWLDGVFPPLDDATAPEAPLAGVSYQIDRVGGDPGEFATLYFGSNGLPDPALTATSDAGLSVSGELRPGIYRVKADVPDGWECRARLLPHLPGGQVDAFVHVRAGFLSGIWTQCVAPAQAQ